MSFDLKSSLYKFLTLGIILAIFFHSYASGIPGVSLAELLLIIACLIILLQNQFSIAITKVQPLLLFFFIALTTSIISMLVQHSSFIQVPMIEVISRLIRYFAYIVIITFGAKYYDLKFALKYYHIFCILISVYIILQFAMYHTLHIYLPTKILPLEWSRIYDVEVLLSSMDRGYFRAYGVFAEPGYAAKFLLPGVALALFGWMKKQGVDYFSLFIITAAIIFTTSLQGILVAFITIIAWLIWNRSANNIKLSRKSIRIFKQVKVTLFILIVSFLILGSFGILDAAIFRMQNIFNVYQEGGGGSTTLRLFRGWSVFVSLPLLFQIIGTGLGNVANFVYDHNIITNYDAYLSSVTAMEYTDGISGTAISTGVIGFMLFCRWIIKLFKKLKGVYKIIFMQFIILLFAGTGVFSITMIFFMGFIYIGYGDKQEI